MEKYSLLCVQSKGRFRGEWSEKGQEKDRRKNQSSSACRYVIQVDVIVLLSRASHCLLFGLLPRKNLSDHRHL